MSTATCNLTLCCRDRIGITAAVAWAPAASATSLVEPSHFGAEGTGLCFLRTVFRAAGRAFAPFERKTCCSRVPCSGMPSNA